MKNLHGNGYSSPLELSFLFDGYIYAGKNKYKIRQIKCNQYIIFIEVVIMVYSTDLHYIVHFNFMLVILSVLN